MYTLHLASSLLATGSKKKKKVIPAVFYRDDIANNLDQEEGEGERGDERQGGVGGGAGRGDGGG